MATYSDTFAADTSAAFTQLGAGAGTLTYDAVNLDLKRSSATGELHLLRKDAAADPTNGWTLEEDARHRAIFFISSTLSSRYGPLVKGFIDGDGKLWGVRAEVTISENKLQVEAIKADVVQGAAINVTTLPAHVANNFVAVELEFVDDTVAARFAVLGAVYDAGWLTNATPITWGYDSGFVALPSGYIEDFGKYESGRAGFLFAPGSTSHRIVEHLVADANNPDLRPVFDSGPPSFSVPVPYSKNLYPPAGWHPLAAQNVMNTPLPASRPVHPRSAEIVANVLATADPTFNGGPQQLIANNAPTSDFSVPCYFASDLDPLYTVTKNSDYAGVWPWEGVQIRCPVEAQPSGGGDHHLFVIQPDGVCWDLFDVVKDDVNHVLTIASGGRFENPYVIDSGPEAWTPTGSSHPIASIASVTCGIHGLIWPQDMEAGEIPYALQMLVKCTDRSAVVAPSRGLAAGCPDFTDQPMTGMRFFLDYSEAEIDALSVDPWQRTILKCMAKYGMIVTDTTGSRWGIRGFISPLTFTSFGWDEPMVRFAQLAIGRGEGSNIVLSGGSWFYRLHPGVDWTRLRVLDTALAGAKVRAGGRWVEASPSRRSGLWTPTNPTVLAR